MVHPFRCRETGDRAGSEGRNIANAPALITSAAVDHGDPLHGNLHKETAEAT
jgi:hypothetical protein